MLALFNKCPLYLAVHGIRNLETNIFNDMGRQKYLRNSGIPLVLVLLVGLTLKSNYNDVTNLRNNWEFKRYLKTLNVNSFINRRELQINKPSGHLPCKREDQKVAAPLGKSSASTFSVFANNRNDL